MEDRQKHPRDGNEPLRHVDVVDLTQDGSGKRIRGGGEHARDSGELQGAQEDVHADGDSGEHHDLGGHPGRPIGQDHEQPGQGVERAGVEVGHERRAAEDVLVPKRQLAVAQHGAHEDVEGIVLLQVVPGDQQVAADQIGDHEYSRWDRNQHDIGPQGSDMCS